MRLNTRSRIAAVITTMTLATAVPLQGCAFLVGAAAGGAMGYGLAYSGYEVQSPITRSPAAADQGQHH